MANYTKSKITTKTPMQKKVVQESVEQVTEPAVEEKLQPKTFEPTDMIPCRSMTNGPLYIMGTRSGILYTWADYNDIQEMEYRDLMYLVRSPQNKEIYAPRIIIEDETIIAQNKNLAALYDSLYTAGDLRDIVKLPVKQMIDAIQNLPIGAKESFKGLISTMIDSHQLDSVQKIKAIDEIFGTRLLLTLAQE